MNRTCLYLSIIFCIIMLLSGAYNAYIKVVLGVTNEDIESMNRAEFIELLPPEIPTDYHQLLWETASYESNSVHGIEQVDGVALGIFQIEPETHKDVYDNFLKYRPHLDKVAQKYGDMTDQDLQHNFQYTAYIAFLCYYRHIYNKKVDLSDKWTRAFLYKKYYNTEEGKGTTKGFYHGR